MDWALISQIPDKKMGANLCTSAMLEDEWRGYMVFPGALDEEDDVLVFAPRKTISGCGGVTGSGKGMMERNLAAIKLDVSEEASMEAVFTPLEVSQLGTYYNLPHEYK